MDWSKLEKLHPDRPRGISAMAAASIAKSRLADCPEGSWTVDWKIKAKWLKWPDGEVHWVPSSTRLAKSKFVDGSPRPAPPERSIVTSGVTVTVEWGYENHSIQIAPDDWAEILDGGAVTLDGENYGYEGQEFSCTWSFSGGLDGDLEVTYAAVGEEWGDGTGFSGKLRDAVIEEVETPSE